MGKELDSQYWKDLADSLVAAGGSLGGRNANFDDVNAKLMAASAHLIRAGRAVSNLQADLTAQD
jgi:hypothetical protein